MVKKSNEIEGKKSNEIELLRKVFFFIFFPGPERASLYGGQEQHQQTGKIKKILKIKIIRPIMT
jgi:hypothetical protein